MINTKKQRILLFTLVLLAAIFCLVGVFVIFDFDSSGIAEAVNFDGDKLSGSYKTTQWNSDHGPQSISWNSNKGGWLKLGGSTDAIIENGIYYTNNATATAGFKGLTGANVTSSSDSYNYGYISVVGNTVKNGVLCSYNGTRYEDSWPLREFELNKLNVAGNLKYGKNSIIYRLQYFQRRVFWKQETDWQMNVTVFYDNILPTVSSTVANNGYTKSPFTVTAVDENFYRLYYKVPGATNFAYQSESSITMPALGENGLYQFYAMDKAGNIGETYSVVYDNVSPTLSCGIQNDGITNAAFTVTASDANFDNLYFKAPNASSYVAVGSTSKTIAAGSTNGLYQFYAIDKAGNQSATYSVTYDNVLPVLSGAVDKTYLKNPFTITASDINFLKLYFKTPGSTNFADVGGSNKSIAAGSVNGQYLFYAIDKAGNQSATITVYFDTVAPMLSCGVQNGGFTNGAFTVSATDGIAYDKLYLKIPGAATFSVVESASKTIAAGSTNGLYQFYAVDKAGNQSTTYSVTYDTVLPILSGAADKAFLNKAFSIIATDVNIANLYFTPPGASGFVSVGSSSKSVAVGSANGTYQFYSTDKAGNNSKTLTVYFDTVAPTLSGLTYNGGFFTARIKATSSPGDLLNQSDALTIFYSRSATGSYPATATIAYASGTELKDEGNYLFRIQDKAGNFTTYKATLDNSAPTLTLAGLNAKNFTKTNASASWLTTVGGVGTQRMNSDDVLTVLYARSANGYYPSAASLSYSSGVALSVEGNYLIVIKDKAGNERKYTFTIDKSAPILSLDGLVAGLSYNGSKDGFSANWNTTVGGVGTQRTNDNDALSVFYSSSTTANFPTTASTPYTRSTVLSDDGNYLIIIIDSSGNTTKYRVVMDSIAPNVSTIAEYLNYAFEFTASDLHKPTIKYTFNGGTVKSDTSGRVSVARNETNYGTWSFYAVDELGNKTATQTVNLYFRSDFGNADNIANEFKNSTWYIVTLTARIFGDIAGKYSFATADAALRFAISKEWVYRVEKLSGGRWSYVNINNESVYEIYTDRAVLDAAVLKYASAYVSDRQTMQLGGNSYPNPTDENGITRSDALTKQSLSYPDMLTAYRNLPLYLVGHKFMFSEPVAGVAGNTRKAQIKYIANDFNLINGGVIDVPYDVKLENVLDPIGAKIQGYFLVTESDRCGNEQKYVIYFDSDTPTLTGRATFGDGKTNVIEFNDDYVTENENVMLYVELVLQTIADNIDEFTVICISGRGLADACYSHTDKLPTLSLENGYYGKYVINIYDRSLNYISFTVRIAGEPATVRNTSLTNETKCTLTIQYDSAINAITGVQLFKVSYDGIYTEMQFDDDGNAVSRERLVYVLRTGGKYVLRFTDIFGRVIETDPLFYMKGLPNGYLSGVRENSVTRVDVTFECFEGNSVWLFQFTAGAWVRADDVMTVTERSGVYYASIAATDKTSAKFKFFLYVSDELNLFTEYRFEIDCIAPTFDIKTEAGDVVERETVTRLPFDVTWNEANVKAYYYLKNNPLGSLGEKSYPRGLAITSPGTYVFRVADSIGNETRFEMTLDNVVSYTLDGNYSVLPDGSYISKNFISVTVTERTTKFECAASNGFTVMNGQKLDVDGTYTFKIVDAYGNELDLIVIIDKLPPVPIILDNNGNTLPMNGKTNRAFTVSCDEENVVMLFNAGSGLETYNGAELGGERTYTFKLTDRMGNYVQFTVTIDKTVKYTIKGMYKELGALSFITRNYFIMSVDEEYSGFEVTGKNGFTFEPGERLATEGEYTVTITDAVGNVITVKLVVDYTPPTIVVKTAADGTIIPKDKTNEPFTVLCDEANVVIKVSRTTLGGEVYGGEVLSELGVYYFTAMDFIGNVAEYTVEIDTAINYIINGNYKRLADGGYISKSNLTVELKEECPRFEVENDEGVTFMPGDAITQEGKYLVTIEDVAGNLDKIIIIIDKTAPTPEITARSGKTVLPGEVINESFKVLCVEYGSNLSISKNGISYAKYDGDFCATDGIFYFIVADFIGNETKFIVEIDLGIDFTIKGQYKQNGNVYASNTDMSVIIDEDYLRFEVTSDNGFTFAPGETVTREGQYTATITDVAGNTAVIVIIIDKTAPTPEIIDISGNAVPMNGVIKSPFNVLVNEAGSKLSYSTGSTFSDYYGEALSIEKKYNFIATDYVGNSVNFTVELDKSVSFEIKGGAKKFGDFEYVTNNSLSVVINEEYLRFEVTGENGFTFAPGETVSREGQYTVTVSDVAGNTVTLVLSVDKTAPTPEILDKSGNDIPINGATRYPFTVNAGENKAKLSYSMNGTSFDNYSGETLDAERKYYFVATDFAGNSISFTVTLDKAVKYTVKGNIVELGEKKYVTRVGFTLNVDEEYSSFDVESENGETFEPGENVRKEGKYTVTITDKVGNIVTLELIIDMTSPEIVSDVSNGGVTNQSVTIHINDFVSAFYYATNSEKIAVDAEFVLEVSGKYEIHAKDAAGNESIYVVTIDCGVDVAFTPTLKNGYIVVGDVTIKFSEEAEKVLTKDGAVINYSGLIKEPGRYTLIATDKQGNVLTTSWTILPAAANNYEFNIPNGYNVSGLKDGNEYGLSGDVISLTVDGVYSLVFSCDGDEFALELTVDTVPPAVTITQGKNQIMFSDATKDDVKYTLYRDGNVVDCHPGTAITERGNYRLVVTDSLGNYTSYEFKLDYINMFGIIVIVIAVIVVAVIVAVVIAYRVKQRVK